MLPPTKPSLKNFRPEHLRGWECFGWNRYSGNTWPVMFSEWAGEGDPLATPVLEAH
jgi:hypothetical protein